MPVVDPESLTWVVDVTESRYADGRPYQRVAVYAAIEGDHISEDEWYPCYDVSDDSGIAPHEVPVLLSAEEKADLDRVMAEFRAWQDRLGDLYAESRPGLQAHARSLEIEARGAQAPHLGGENAGGPADASVVMVPGVVLNLEEHTVMVTARTPRQVFGRELFGR